MKFEKNVYKAAIDKIDSSEARQKHIESVNQKYKAGILSGDITDDMAGWDASGTYYDNEMLKKEVNKKLLVHFILLMVGVVFLVFVVGMCVESIYLKLYGTKCTAYYGWSEELEDYGFIYRWKYVDGELEDDPLVQFGKLSGDEKEAIKKMTWFSMSAYVSEDVELIANYDMEGDQFIKENNLNVDKSLVSKAYDAGIEPINIYLYTDLQVPVWMEQGRKQYVELYYMPSEGETILDAKMIVRWQVAVASLLVPIIYIAILIWRMIKLGKEQRAYK